MRSFQVKRFHDLLILCFFMLAMAGCQNDKAKEAGNSSASAAAVSDTAHADGKSIGIILQDNNGEDYNPVIDPANFVGTIDNPYCALTPGKVWVYEGMDEDVTKERVEIEVTPDQKTILGVAITVVRERAWEDGELVEDTLDWFAQDKDGNVWYFGEDSKDIEDGQVVSTKGSWEAGVNGAKAGMVMKGSPQVGDAYRQEFLKGEAEDMGQVLSVGEAVRIGLANYENCVQTKDWTPLEPDLVEHKFYSKEAGNVILEKKIAGGSGQIELIEIKNQ